MPRYIDADEMIDSVCGMCDGLCESFDTEKCRNCRRDGRCEWRKSLDDVQTIEARPVVRGEWIPVEEQKPEENKNVKFYTDERLTFASVIVCGGRRGVTITNRLCVKAVGIPYLDELATDGWEWSAGFDDVTHWMPLPEPPNCGADNRGEADDQ